MDAAVGDLRLLLGPPAIDVGSNAAVHEWVTTDLLGWARITNETVDTGAHETPLTTYLPPELRGVP